MKSDEVIEKIRRKLENSSIDPDKRTVLNIYQFNFTQTNGVPIKSMVFDFKALRIYELDAAQPSKVDAIISVSDDDFYLIGTKQRSFEDMMKKEKVKVEGDAEAIKKMIEKFHINSCTDNS